MSTMACLGVQKTNLTRRAAFFGTQRIFVALPVRKSTTPKTSLLVQAGVIGPGKRWESYDLNKNGKPVRVKMHVKSGDLVQVIAGKDQGKVGTIKKVNTKTGQVLLEGVNIKTKHVKPEGEEEGKIAKVEYPIHHSNVQHYSEAKQVRSRIGRKMQDGKKVRYLIKTGEILDN